MEIPKYQYINILKGIAVLGVIAVHSHQSIPDLCQAVKYAFNYGQLGVQLFFLISAITLCISSKKRHEQLWRYFYLRRVFRIAPLYYFGIAWYLLTGCYFMYLSKGTLQMPSQYTPLNILANITFLNSFYAPANNNIVPGGWSIATEMNFYLVFPILFLLHENKNFKSVLTYTVLLIIGCFLIELVLKVRPDVDVFIYYNIVNQLSVFLIGICTYRLLLTAVPGWRALSVAFFLMIVSCILFNQVFKPGFYTFIVPILSSIAFSIFTLRLSRRREFNGVFWRVLERFGLVSFSMYLLHFLVLDCVRIAINYVIGNEGHILPEALLLATYGFTVFFTYFFALVSYKIIEQPGIKLGEKLIISLTPK
jgi:peptidoglycan/LPS O-acetylase OafA/YrhL